MGDLRPPIAAALTAFGVAATVTRPAPDDTPIVTTAIWVPPDRRSRSDEVYEYRNELARRQAERLVLGLPRSAVPTLPIGTVIAAPLVSGATSQTWRVEEHERDEPDEWRVVVVPGESES